MLAPKGLYPREQDAKRICGLLNRRNLDPKIIYQMRKRRDGLTEIFERRIAPCKS